MGAIGGIGTVSRRAWVSVIGLSLVLTFVLFLLAGRSDAAVNPPIQAGKVLVGDSAVTVPLNPGFTTPIVVAGPPEFADPTEVTVVISNVTSSSFDIKLKSWPNQTAHTGGEMVSFLAVEAGSHTLTSGAQIDAGTILLDDPGSPSPGGTIGTLDPQYQAVTFGVPFAGPAGAPGVMTTVASENDSDTVIVRVKDVTTTGFRAKLREAEQSPPPTAHPDETVNYVAWTYGTDTGSDPLDWEVLSATTGHNFLPVSHTSPKPCVLSQINTANGSNTATTRHRNVQNSSLNVKVEEERAFDNETNHGPETIAILAFGCAPPMQVGKVSVGDTPLTVPINPGFTTPIVVAGPPESADPTEVTLVISNITPASFDMKLKSWPNQTAHTGNELVSFLVVEAGSHLLASGGLYDAGTILLNDPGSPSPGGTIGTLDPQYQPLTFLAPFAAPPGVMTTVASENDPDTVIVRVKDVTTNGARAKLREAEQSPPPSVHPDETVNYVAWTYGTDTGSDPLNWEVLSATTGHNFLPVNHTSPKPCVLSQTNTANGSNTATTRHTDVQPGSLNVKVEEERAFDNETNHGPETIAILAFDCGGSNQPPTPGTDSYETIGNTELRVDVAPTAGQASVQVDTSGGATPILDGVLDNDTDPESDPLMVTGVVGCADVTAPFDCPTNLGGNFILQANGQLKYDPPVGQTAVTDDFSYLVSDGLNLPVAAQVQFELTNLTVYVDNSVAGPGQGTSNDPFNTLPASPMFPPDTIYVARGTGTDLNLDGGIGLQPGQRLIGSDSQLDYLPLLLNGTPSLLLLPDVAGAPHLSNGAGGVGITLADNSLVRGLDIHVLGPGSGISATALNHPVTLENVDVHLASTGLNDVGVDVLNSDGDLVFDGFGVIGEPASTGPLMRINGGSADVVGDDGLFLFQDGTGPTLEIKGGHTGTFDQGPASFFGVSDGPGLQFDNADGMYNFNGTTTLNGGDAGIDILSGSSGTFTFGANTAITDPSGIGLLIDSGDPNITYSGTIDNNSGSSVRVRFTSGATVKVDGTITDTGTGISIVSNTASGITFSGPGNSFSTGGSTAINVNQNPGSTVDFTGGNLDIDTILGRGFLASDGGTITVTGTGNTIDTSGGPGVDMSDVEIGANGIVFDSITRAAGGPLNSAVIMSTVSGGTFEVTGPTTVSGASATNPAISINGGSATFTFASITGNGGGIGVDGIVLDGLGTNSSFNVTGTTQLDNYTGDGIAILNMATTGVDITFGQTNINTTVGQVAAGDGITIRDIFGTANNLDIDFGAVTIGNATDDSNIGLDIDNILAGSTVDIDFAGFSSTRPFIGFDIDDLDSVGGTITVAGTTTITNASFRGIDISNSAGNVTFAADTTITNNPGFNGSGVDLGTGAGGANTGTYSFTGLDSSVTGANAHGLRAQDSGTINVTGASNTVNNTGSGIGVIIDNTTIGGLGVTFDSVSVNGATSGIDLDTTGAGLFTLGGGTLSNTIGTAVLLDSTNFSMSGVTIQASGGFTVDTTGSVLAGSGNTDTAFSCNDGGTNTGFITFNAGADTCP